MATPKIGVFMGALAVLGILGAVFAAKAKAAPAPRQLPEPERSAAQEDDYNTLSSYVNQAAKHIQNYNASGARQIANAIRNHSWNDPDIKAAAMKEANKIDMAAKDIEDYNAAQKSANASYGPTDELNLGPAFYGEGLY